MQAREQRLLVILLAALGLWVLLPVLEGVLLGPFQSRLDERALLTERVAARQAERDELDEIERQLLFWTIDSLPPEPLNAQRVYSEWLVDLARLSGLRDLEPTLPNRTTVPGVYVTIPVSLKAHATLRELAAFLYHFDRARVLHRIARCDVVSPETEGNPLLEVTLVAEGLSLPEARQRARLFPRATLTAALSPGDDRIEIDSASGFPEGPLRVRIGTEFLQVVRRDGAVWQVERGADHTSAAAHEAGSTVEMAAVRPAAPGDRRSLDDYERLLAAGPFVKPRPPVVYDPQLAPIADAELIRGGTFSTQARLTGWDPADGQPQYRLDEFSPASMQVDGAGRITWTPGPDAESDVYPAGVRVTSLTNPQRNLSQSFAVTLREPNLPPQLSIPPTIPIAWIGRVWSLPVTAKDPDMSGELRFSLGGQPPAGMSIDPVSGVLRWEVADTVEPAELPITIQVSDGGAPPQIAAATATVHVQDDAAQFTYLVGCIRDDEEWTALLYDRSTNVSREVHVGDKFRFSDIAGTVSSISLTAIEFSDERGTWKLQQEQPLREAALISGPPPPAAAEAPGEHARPAPAPAVDSPPPGV